MKTETSSPLKDLKFASAEIYPYPCDIKGEPIANISSDTLNFGIIFPKKVTPAQAEEYAQRIVQSVNMHDELVSLVREMSVALNYKGFDKRSVNEELMYQEAIELLKQAEQK